MATIKVFSSQTNELKTITTSATTWGELHDALNSGNYTSPQSVTRYNLSDTACKIKETGLSFDNGEAGRRALLPVGQGDGFDFTMFVIPQKIKSGNYITNEQIMAELQKINSRMSEIEKTFKEFMGELEHEVADCVEHKAVSSREQAEIAELARMVQQFAH